MPYYTADKEEMKPQWQARLEDSMSQSTREKRRLFLVSSTIALVTIILGILPTKIEALGVSIESVDKNKLLFLFFLVLMYSAVGFVLYAWADFHLQSRVQKNTINGSFGDAVKGQATPCETLNYNIRFLFDFLAPLFYGCYAIWKMYSAIDFSFL